VKISVLQRAQEFGAVNVLEDGREASRGPSSLRELPKTLAAHSREPVESVQNKTSGENLVGRHREGRSVAGLEAFRRRRSKESDAQRSHDGRPGAPSKLYRC